MFYVPYNILPSCQYVINPKLSNLILILCWNNLLLIGSGRKPRFVAYECLEVLKDTESRYTVYLGLDHLRENFVEPIFPVLDIKNGEVIGPLISEKMF